MRTKYLYDRIWCLMFVIYPKFILHTCLHKFIAQNFVTLIYCKSIIYRVWISYEYKFCANKYWLKYSKRVYHKYHRLYSIIIFETRLMCFLRVKRFYIMYACKSKMILMYIKIQRWRWRITSFVLSSVCVCVCMCTF